MTRAKRPRLRYGGLTPQISDLVNATGVNVEAGLASASMSSGLTQGEPSQGGLTQGEPSRDGL